MWVGCTNTESIDIAIVLPEDAPSPVTVRIRAGRADGMCPIEPTSTEYMSDFTEGNVPTQIGTLKKGLNAFVATAWNTNCDRCYQGCATVTVGDEDMVRVELAPVDCTPVLCAPPNTDAGVDGGVDGAMDGGVDAPVDAGPDSGPTDAGMDAFDASDAGGTVWVAVAAGDTHTCAIREGGDVFCWGENHGGTGSPSVPQAVPGELSAEQLSVGATHSCAVSDGRVYCWGDGRAYDELGTSGGVTTMPTLVPGIPSDSMVVDLAVGGWHSCVALADGRVYCWGQNQSGELGTSTGTRIAQEAPLPEGFDADIVAAGFGPSCAGALGGALYCWGFWSTQAPLGTAHSGSMTAEPMPVVGFTGVESVSAGGAEEVGFGGHICAASSGRLSCWGRNQVDQSNPGGMGRLTSTTLVEDLGAVREHTTGGAHSCAIGVDGGVFCWGHNNVGQLGNGSGVSVAIPGLEARAISAGAAHTCAIDMEGALLCWGRGDSGQLGNGGTENSPLPVRVAEPG